MTKSTEQDKTGKAPARMTLTSHVMGPASWDQAPGVDVELDHVPVLNVLASPEPDGPLLYERLPLPDYGITMHMGQQDIPQILQRRQIDAYLQSENLLYEVRATVQIGSVAPSGTLTVEKVPELQVLNLPRANEQANRWLQSLISDQLAEFFGKEAADQLSVAMAVAQHPQLLDELARHPKLSHIAVIVWESALPMDAKRDPRRVDEPMISSAKLGTLYTRDPQRVQLQTINSEHVRAVLPPWVGSNLHMGRVRKQNRPGMR